MRGRGRSMAPGARRDESTLSTGFSRPVDFLDNGCCITKCMAVREGRAGGCGQNQGSTAVYCMSAALSAPGICQPKAYKEICSNAMYHPTHAIHQYPRLCISHCRFSRHIHRKASMKWTVGITPATYWFHTIRPAYEGQLRSRSDKTRPFPSHPGNVRFADLLERPNDGPIGSIVP